MRIVRDPLADPTPLIKRVYAYVAYRLGNGPEAEDVTSEVFERALRYRDSYDGRRGQPAAWLVGIARHCVDDALRKRPPEAAPWADEESASGIEDGVIRRLDLTAALARLDDRSREIIALRYGADMRVKEIAALLSLRVNTAEVALHRALERLRQVLDEDATAARHAPRDSGRKRAAGGE